MRPVFELGEHLITIEEFFAILLHHLGGIAQNQLGKISSVIIMVPADYSAVQREATMVAAKTLGMPVPRLINEPTAAAIALTRTHKMGPGLILIIDISGGTADVSLVSVTEEREYTIKGTKGNFSVVRMST